MDSMSFNYNNNMEEPKAIFTTPSETLSVTTESFAPSSNKSMPGGAQEFFPRNGMFNMGHQEPRVGDTVPAAPDMDEVMMNFRMNGTDLLFDEVDHNSHNYYSGAGTNRPETATSSNTWSHGAGVPASGKTEMMDTFEFLIKSLASANNYVSMLTREQLSLLRCIRPGLLYEFLQEVLRARTEKRTRRGLPSECAFCKNNGENEECYSQHVLKDWRGRVQCPVLRAFRCPRCGATGDYAHTIKYCPENPANERNNGLSNRRRGPPPESLLLSNSTGVSSNSCPPTPAPPAPSPSPASVAFSPSWWSSYAFN